MSITLTHACFVQIIVNAHMNFRCVLQFGSGLNLLGQAYMKSLLIFQSNRKLDNKEKHKLCEKNNYKYC